jgi:hypothetical protein
MLDLLCSGPQALAHLEAIRAVRSITRVHVWGRKPARAAAVASAVAAASGLPVRVCESAQEAVAEADIVCTLTSAQAAVLEGAWLKPGAPLRAPQREGGGIGGALGLGMVQRGLGWSWEVVLVLLLRQLSALSRVGRAGERRGCVHAYAPRARHCGVCLPCNLCVLHALPFT